MDNNEIFLKDFVQITTKTAKDLVQIWCCFETRMNMPLPESQTIKSLLGNWNENDIRVEKFG